MVEAVGSRRIAAAMLSTAYCLLEKAQDIVGLKAQDIVGG